MLGKHACLAKVRCTPDIGEAGIFVIKRANVYIDGFNLYYGALKGQCHVDEWFGGLPGCPAFSYAA
jgi:hypothetical protein